MKFISYYTKGTFYEKFAENLEKSFQQFGIKNYIIEGIEDLGSWKENTDYKSTFIFNKLNKLKESVCWIDCDAILENYPQLIIDIDKLDYDFAFHKRRDRELLSGTLYFNYNENSIELITEWIGLIRIHKNTNQWEQRFLQMALSNLSIKINFNIFNLPAEYCCIHDLMPRMGEINGPIVIKHYQAARLYEVEKEGKDNPRYDKKVYDHLLGRMNV